MNNVFWNGWGGVGGLKALLKIPLREVKIPSHQTLQLCAAPPLPQKEV